MSARLPAHILVGALLQRVNDAGGIAVVRARGDRQAGAILILDEQESLILERGIGPDGNAALIETGPAAGREESLDDYWQRRRQRDPDLWVVALDIPQAKRFAAETICDD
ncbi:MAG: DUF1491 family protein [Candidatus Sphingomonas colombiensis]|nr:DUF1491 family protein [Sphingomonas sp.]WEK44497.1 MAG: DUF1491 family protein [Sphingomonas sp.]